MRRWGIAANLNLGKILYKKINIYTYNIKVDMVLEEAGIDGDGKFRYNDFVDRLNSEN